MCGIIAIAGNRPVQHRLLDSLQRLEYRGYDSAGLATLDDSGAIRITRAVGKIAALESALADSPTPGDTGIGHTRWATHGAPTEANAHPHSTERVAVVHNGIIENFAALREELKRAGHLFTSETDTEVIARLLDYHIDRYGDLQEAFAATLRRLRGAFAIAVIFKDQPGLVMGARLGSPLVVGMAEGEMVLGSDAIAVAPHTNRVIYLDEGDWVVLRPEECIIFDRNDTIADRPVQTVAASYALAEKGEHRHFMMKEIHEQPEGITRTLGRFVAPSARRLVALEGVDFAAARELNIIACGTASLAGEIARYWFEDIAGLPTRVEIASEFRYRNPALAPDGIALAISQSGETADTKAAFVLCKQRGQT